jgi:hypothetical protein
VTAYRSDLDAIAASGGQVPEPQRLERLFDVVWRHLMDDRPDAATFLGWPEGGDRSWPPSTAAASTPRTD